MAIKGPMRWLSGGYASCEVRWTPRTGLTLRSDPSRCGHRGVCGPDPGNSPRDSCIVLRQRGQGKARLFTRRSKEVTPLPRPARATIIPMCICDELKQRPQRRFKDSARPLLGKGDLTSPSDGNNNRNKAVIAVYLLSGGGWEQKAGPIQPFYRDTIARWRHY